MKISLNWLRDYVAWDWSDEELAHRLTMAGLNVEAIEKHGPEWSGVVAARVLECRQHPDADRLSVCVVDDGVERKQVVCGAPNVRTGQTVLFARVGSELPGGLRIKKSRLRGVDSHGMICSAAELGLSADAEGILVLEEGPVPGTPAADVVGYRDTVFEIEVTPNRPDWLCHYGVAREVAALTGSLLDAPQTWTPPKTGGDRPEISVEIADFADCPRYTAHVARGIAVGPSPRWMQDRLRAVGARPINNVVDVTNYVLFELGQPLHAFDLRKLAGNRLSVRRAEPGSVMRTLDGLDRKLDGDDLVIADAERPVAMAGVMGGEDSEVEENSVEILLESAFFDPSVVRRAARRHQLASESSYRFERGADWDAVETGARRALHLLQELAGARVETAVVDRQDPDLKEQPPVTLRVAQANRLLGTSLTSAEVVNHLQAIGLKCQPVGGSGGRQGSDATLSVAIPTFRRDLHEEVDLIEEVARVHGFDNLEGDTHRRVGGGVRRRPDDVRDDGLRGYLDAVGYSEIVTSSFMAREDLDRLGVAEDDVRRTMLSVLDPHHGGETLLRTTLVPSLLRVARRNVNADWPTPFRLFQINKAFLPAGSRRPQGGRPGEERLPEETWTLLAAVVGRRDEVMGGVDAGAMEIKGLVDALSARMRTALRAEPGDAQPYLQTGLQWRIADASGASVGAAGVVSRRALREMELDVPVALLELELGQLDAESGSPRYQPFPRYPAVKRDLSLIVPDGVAFGDVESVVADAGAPLLESCELFDVFRGKNVPDGHAAYGIRLKFQSAKGNLKGKTVDRAINAIVGGLKDKLGVELRS